MGSHGQRLLVQQRKGVSICKDGNEENIAHENSYGYGTMVLMAAIFDEGSDSKI